MKYARVEVEWEDIYTLEGWHAPDTELTPALVRQVGYILRDTETHLVLISSYATAEDDSDVADITVLPRSVVRKVTPI